MNYLLSSSYYPLDRLGLRKNFVKNFNYEFQVGLGVGKILKPGYDIQAVPNLSFRIGYDF